MTGRLSDLSAQLRSPRLRSVGLTAGAGWIGRIVAALAQLYAIRILTEMLGVEGYAAFAVITGLAGWFLLADFGLGAALQNFIAGKRVAGESALAGITAVVLALTAAMVALSLLWVVLAGRIGPALLGGFAGVSSREAALTFLAFAIPACGTGIGQIASRICFAEHRGYVGHAMTSGAIVLGVVGLAALSKFEPPGALAWSVLIYQAPSWIVPSAFLLIYLRRHAGASGLWAGLDKAALRAIWRQGRPFLLFNVLAALVLYMDYIILSQTIAGPDVAVYAIFAKIFALGFFVFNSVIQAYWPLSAELFQRGLTHELKPVIRNCIAFGFAVVVGAGLCFLMLRDVIVEAVAPGSGVVLSAALIPYFVGYWLVRVWCDTFAMLVQSAGKAILLCWIVPVQAALNLTLGYWGASNYGLPGMMLGMTASFLLTVAWLLPLLVARLYGPARTIARGSV